MTKKLYPEMICIADICLCEYTDHGHCGVIKDGEVLNDETLELFIVKGGSQLCRSGRCRYCGTFGYDGRRRIGHMRHALMRPVMHTLIMACVKYASAFYRPIQRGSDSAPAFGDRKSYQMDFRNRKEALLETELDVEEGADILMVGDRHWLIWILLELSVKLLICRYAPTVSAVNMP